jgi:ABC-type bacteriocin/lantibiotic exporter with double-glycine peptidase domain
MLKNLSELNLIFKICKINNFYFLSIIILINSLLELVSFGALIPLVSSFAYDTFISEVVIFIKNMGLERLSDFLDKSKTNFYLILISTIFLLYTVKYIFNLFFYYHLSHLKIYYEKVISSKILSIFFSGQNNDILDLPKSKILQDFNVRLGSISSAVRSLSNLLTETIVLLLLLIFLVLNFSLKFTYGFLILIFFSLIFFAFYKNKVVQWSNDRGVGGDNRNKNLIDIFDGLRELIIYKKFNFLEKDFIKNNEQFLNPQKKIIFLNSLPKLFLEFITVIFILASLLFAIIYEKNTSQILSFISISGLIIIRTLPSLNKIIVNYSQIKYLTEPISSIKTLLILDKERIFSDQTCKINFEKKIILKDIDFDYDDKTRLLSNLNLEINKNTKIVIFGDTGSGKSTLIDIISGIKNQKKGEVIVDDKYLNKFDKHQWIDEIAYISQKVYLFHTSIRNNITFKADNEEIDKDRFDKSLILSDLNPFIENKVKKEFTSVGEFGQNLSGGQRQKIGLARALYSSRSILILDESTNAIDKESEKLILNNFLRMKDKTIIMITHSKENIKLFDLKYNLKNGNLIKI